MKKSVKWTRASLSIPVSVANLRTLVDCFSAVPAGRHQGYVLTTPDDIQREWSLIVMAPAALAANVKRCKETWGAVWLGSDDNDEILGSGGWYAKIAMTHNKDPKIAPVTVALASDKTGHMHARFFGSSLGSYNGDLLSMSDECAAIALGVRTAYPDHQKDPKCGWYMYARGVTPDVHARRKATTIDDAGKVKILSDLWLLGTSPSDDVLRAGAWALFCYWRGKYHSHGLDTLSKYLDVELGWHMGATPTGMQNTNLPCESAFSDLESHSKDAARNLQGDYIILCKPRSGW